MCMYSRYKSGLLALNGLLCVHDQFSESEVAAQYGSDAGLAFWLMGELNAQLSQNKEAAKLFKAALKYNPFLWTAYQSLCEMGKAGSLTPPPPPPLPPPPHSLTNFNTFLGEFVDPKECFQISDYPSFLQPSSCFSSAPFTTAPPPLFSHNAATLTSEPSQPLPPTLHTAASTLTSDDVEVDLTCTEQNAMDTGPSLVGGASSLMGGVSSAFIPVESKGVVTPSLYGDPAVGKAVASSTPAAARSLIFSTSNRPPAATVQGTLPEDKGIYIRCKI